MGMLSLVLPHGARQRALPASSFLAWASAGLPRARDDAGDWPHPA